MTDAELKVKTIWKWYGFVFPLCRIKSFSEGYGYIFHDGTVCPNFCWKQIPHKTGSKMIPLVIVIQAARKEPR